MLMGILYWLTWLLLPVYRRIFDVKELKNINISSFEQRVRDASVDYVASSKLVRRTFDLIDHVKSSTPQRYQSICCGAALAAIPLQ